MLLTYYDLSGIQDYIFQTSKLKEEIGASSILSKVLNNPLKDYLHNEAQLRGFIDNPPDKADYETVYINGGNALVVFSGGSQEDQEKKRNELTGQLRKELYKNTGGNIRLCTGSTAVAAGEALSDVVNKYMEDLEGEKRSLLPARAAGGFSINSLDNETNEPLLVIRNDNDKNIAQSMTRYLKNREYEKEKGRERNLATRDSQGFVQLKDIMYTDDFEKLLPSIASKRGFLAYVHIDGNGIGALFSHFIESTRGKSLADSLIFLRTKTNWFEKALYDALTLMVNVVYKKELDNSEVLPLRILVQNGDDITFICRSNKAFECISAFVDGLKGSNIGIGVGIAFTSYGHPATSAYREAEKLSRNAKKCVANRQNMLDINEYGEDPPPSVLDRISAIDFSILMSEVPNNSRAGNSKHPYFLNAKLKPHNELFQFEDFLRLRGICVAVADGERIGKRKLRALFDAYAKDNEEAQYDGAAAKEYADFIRAQHQDLYLGDNADEKAFLSTLESVIDTDASGNKYPKLYDALASLTLG